VRSPNRCIGPATRTLLGKLCRCAWNCVKAETRRLLGGRDVVPGMVAGIQTHGQLLHWHPHVHALATCGAFAADGRFLELNFQILSPLDFLAEFTQHIPPKGTHLVRYYGWYSNKARGVRRKQTESQLPQIQATVTSPSRCSRTWAMLIKRVYEVDPLTCPQCGNSMKVVGFIEPPQQEVIQRILTHCGLWRQPDSRSPPHIQTLPQDEVESVEEIVYFDSPTDAEPFLTEV